MVCGSNPEYLTFTVNSIEKTKKEKEAGKGTFKKSSWNTQQVEFSNRIKQLFWGNNQYVDRHERRAFTSYGLTVLTIILTAHLATSEVFDLGIGCGSVGRSVASNTRDSRF